MWLFYDKMHFPLAIGSKVCYNKVNPNTGKNRKEDRKMTKKQLGQQLNAVLREIEITARVNLWKSVDGTKTEADAQKLDALHTQKNTILNAMRNA